MPRRTTTAIRAIMFRWVMTILPSLNQLARFVATGNEIGLQFTGARLLFRIVGKLQNLFRAQPADNGLGRATAITLDAHLVFAGSRVLALLLHLVVHRLDATPIEVIKELLLQRHIIIGPRRGGNEARQQQGQMPRAQARQTSMPSGCSISRRRAAIYSAPIAPSTTRWSTDKVPLMTVATASWPSFTSGCCVP